MNPKIFSALTCLAVFSLILNLLSLAVLAQAEEHSVAQQAVKAHLKERAKQRTQHNTRVVSKIQDGENLLEVIVVETLAEGKIVDSDINLLLTQSNGEVDLISSDMTLIGFHDKSNRISKEATRRLLVDYANSEMIPNFHGSSLEERQKRFAKFSREQLEMRGSELNEHQRIIYTHFAAMGL
ncbi:hypothetical protein GW915_11260 [bacterium]|nr:hypothetical protein [bacterium]